MKALFLARPGEVAPGEIEAPEPRPDEILLDVLACGICGGDIKVFKQGRTNAVYPHFLGGHEISGRVAAVGSQVEGLREGDLVVHCFNNYCGSCLNCKLGRQNFCLNMRGQRGGGFAEQVVLHTPPQRHGTYKLPAGFDPIDAAICEPLMCAIGGVLRAAPQPGEWFALIGLGGLGQMVGQILAAHHVHVIGIDIQPDKVQQAASFCAAVVDASKQDPIAEVQRLTKGVGVDAVMEVVGVSETLKQALEMARMGARIVLVGVFTKLVDGLNADRIFRKDLTLYGAKGPSPLTTTDGMPLAVRYILDGIVRPREILTAFPFAQAQAAFDAQAHGSVAKAVIVQP